MGSEAVRLTSVDIDNALDNNHFQVIFQPVFHLTDGALMRVESFVRWTHPGLGVLPPGAFISFFESQGRMGELTRHVITTALDAYMEWRGTEAPGFSVNLSQADITDTDFAKWLAALLRKKKFPAELVTLECPAVPATMKLAEATRHFARLSKTGARLAIEVRGRANDLLRTIEPFPFDELKTGGSAILRFARTMRGGPGLTAISELLDLARANDADIIAVGVEDQASLKALAGLGFTAAQGNYLASIGDLAAFEPQLINKVRTVLDLPEADEDVLSALMKGHERPPEPEAPVEEPAPEAEPAAKAEKPAGEEQPAAQEGRLTPEKIALLKKKQAQMAAKRRAERKAMQALIEAEEEPLRREREEKALREALARKRADENARKLQSRLSQAYEYQLPNAEKAEDDGQAGLLLGGSLANKTHPPAPAEPPQAEAPTEPEGKPAEQPVAAEAETPAAKQPEVTEPVEAEAQPQAGTAETIAEDPAPKAATVVAPAEPEAAEPENLEPETVEPISEKPEEVEEIAAEPVAEVEDRAEAEVRAETDAGERLQQTTPSEAPSTEKPEVLQAAAEPEKTDPAQLESEHNRSEQPAGAEPTRPQLRSSWKVNLHLTSIADVKSEETSANEALETEKPVSAGPVSNVEMPAAGAPAAEPEPAPEPHAEAVQEALPGLVEEDLPEDFRSEEEVLDEAFEGAEVLDPSAVHEDKTEGPVELDSTERMIADRLGTPRRRKRKNFLMRRYRIMPTHFWPRAWKRKWHELRTEPHSYEDPEEQETEAALEVDVAPEAEACEPEAAEASRA